MTWQIYSNIYSYYNSAAVFNAAGYPIEDTAPCPTNAFGNCDYQLFGNNYAIFAFSSPVSTAFSVADPIYTEWTNNGSVYGPLGVATAPAIAITSIAMTAGTQQTFLQGAIFTYPAAASAPSTYTVAGQIYGAFNGAGGLNGLGFPTSEEVVLSGGLHRQTFESGRIDWNPNSVPAAPALAIFPIAEIDIVNAAAGLVMNAGGLAILGVNVYDIRGSAVTGRTLSWSTSNGSVAAVQGSGATAIVQAVGAGAASIYVTGEGKTSAPLKVVVGEACCVIGEGAPNATISLAFQTAALRNHLAASGARVSAVTPIGSGYVQTFGVAIGGVTTVAISESADSATAYVIAGNLYAAYLANGGFTGSLGYPPSDASAGGTQLLEGGAALDGSPVLPVFTQGIPLP